jgi:hypothetical protein
MLSFECCAARLQKRRSSRTTTVVWKEIDHLASENFRTRTVITLICVFTDCEFTKLFSSQHRQLLKANTFSKLWVLYTVSFIESSNYSGSNLTVVCFSKPIFSAFSKHFFWCSSFELLIEWASERVFRNSTASIFYDAETKAVTSRPLNVTTTGYCYPNCVWFNTFDPLKISPNKRLVS